MSAPTGMWKPVRSGRREPAPDRIASLFLPQPTIAQQVRWKCYVFMPRIEGENPRRCINSSGKRAIAFAIGAMIDDAREGWGLPNRDEGSRGDACVRLSVNFDNAGHRKCHG